MRILLLSGAIPKYEKHGDYGRAAPQMHPYGALCLAAMLEEQGFSDIKILDTEVRNLCNKHILNEIRKFHPDIIGITTYTLAMKRITQLLIEIRLSFGNIVLVAGGPHVTLYPDELLEKGLVDYCCVGEGEYAFLELAKTIEQGKKANGIQNIVFKDKERVIQSPNRSLIDNLDELPFPSFHLIKDDMNKYYPQPMTYMKRPVVTLITSRGCPYGCRFCSAKAMWTSRWRSNSSVYIVNMIEYLIREFNIKEVCFFEDTFTVNRERVIKFCKLIIERNLDILWSASVNLRDVDEEVLKLMRDANCWLISCGIETGNDGVMKFINKPLTIREVEQKVKLANRLGIKVRGYFMFGHMVDTKETIRQTINFSRSLPLHSANYSIFVPTPGSEFYNSIYPKNHLSEDYEFATYSSEDKKLKFVPRGLTSDYLIHIQKKAFFEFFFRFRQIISYLRSLHSFEDIRRYAIMSHAAVTLLIKTLTAVLKIFSSKMFILLRG